MRGKHDNRRCTIHKCNAIAARSTGMARLHSRSDHSSVSLLSCNRQLAKNYGCNAPYQSTISLRLIVARYHHTITSTTDCTLLVPMSRDLVYMNPYCCSYSMIYVDFLFSDSNNDVKTV